MLCMMDCHKDDVMQRRLTSLPQDKQGRRFPCALIHNSMDEIVEGRGENSQPVCVL